MTADGRSRDEDVGGGPFDGIDPKLTIFALANGMDLEKNGEVRRLAWYRDGHDRGILLTVSEDGTISVKAQAWSRGDDTSLKSAPVGEALEPDELGRALTSLLEKGLDAANAL
ncbi:MAG: hypothetical protein LJF04_14345 [Gemmatimonadetes bacterium]|nr:hypothetical protein [Gemmatimonadota bacterium]